VNPGLPSVNDREFDRVIGSAEVPVLVAFWKPGCGHCRALAVELQQVRAQVGSSVLILAMNVEENHQIPAELEITSLPAVALYQGGAFTRFIGGIGKKEDILRQVPHSTREGG
jgi:thioredoxin 1